MKSLFVYRSFKCVCRCLCVWGKFFKSVNSGPAVDRDRNIKHDCLPESTLTLNLDLRRKILPRVMCDGRYESVGVVGHWDSMHVYSLVLFRKRLYNFQVLTLEPRDCHRVCTFLRNSFHNIEWQRFRWLQFDFLKTLVAFIGPLIRFDQRLRRSRFGKTGRLLCHRPGRNRVKQGQ